MKKIIVPGLASGLVMLIISVIISFLLNKIFPSVVLEYTNQSLYRAWSDPLMQIFMLSPFLIGLFMAWVWNKTKSLFPAKRCQAGLWLGLIYWLSTIPGMFISYTTFQISLLMVVTWFITVLVQALAGGWLIAKMNK